MEIQEGVIRKKQLTTEKIKTPCRGCVKSKKLSVRKDVVPIVNIRNEERITKTLNYDNLLLTLSRHCSILWNIT